jgi:hypothetical protein
MVLCLKNNEKRTRATQKDDILGFEIILTKEVFFHSLTQVKSGFYP